MALFYDPKRKKTNEWVFAAFIIVPIILVFVFFLIGKNAVKKDRSLSPDKSAAEGSANF